MTLASDAGYRERDRHVEETWLWESPDAGIARMAVKRSPGGGALLKLWVITGPSVEVWLELDALAAIGAMCSEAAAAGVQP